MDWSPAWLPKAAVGFVLLFASLIAGAGAVQQQLHHPVQTLSQVLASTTPELVEWIPLSQLAVPLHHYAVEGSTVTHNNAVDLAGRIVNRTLETDPSMFLIPTGDPSFAKDSENVFFDGAIIIGADPRSFRVLGSQYEFGGYAKDARSAYYEESGSSGTVAPIPRVDLATFANVGYGYARDKNHVYRFGNIIDGADPRTFSFLGFSGIQGVSGDGLYTMDSGHVFYDGVELAEADPKTFALIFDGMGDVTGYAKNKNYVYNAYEGFAIEGADPRTFAVLSRWYAKDKFNVYSYDASVVAGTDATIGTPILGANEVDP
jgi:hypothetical protein